MLEQNLEPRIPHYHGDKVRVIFILAAGIMVIALPMVRGEIGLPVAYSIIGILAVTIMAGITNPLQKWTAVTNAVVSLLGLGVFETYAVFAYQALPQSPGFIALNQALALLFFIAAYYSMKTLRGFILNKPK